MEFHIKQGQPFQFLNDEKAILQSLTAKLGISAADGLYLADNLCQLPQRKVGILKLPSRTIVVNPRHQGINLSHIIRMYYFVSNASSLDNPNDPEYSLSNNTFNLDFAGKYIQELREIVRKGIAVSYVSVNSNLSFVKGRINYEKTLFNLVTRKKQPVTSEFEEITTAILINKILAGALLKIREDISIPDFIFLSNSLPKCSIEEAEKSLDKISLNRNNLHYRKAINLAKVILKDIAYTNIGKDLNGEGFLIDYDDLFEKFIRNILIYYSGDSDFSSWAEDKKYAEYELDGKILNRSYRPDILYKFTGGILPKALAVIDVKNKIPDIFSNQDIYQMEFYGMALQANQLILVYPSNFERSVDKLIIQLENIGISKIHAVYINLTGETEHEFSHSLKFFCEQVITIIRS